MCTTWWKNLWNKPKPKPPLPADHYDEKVTLLFAVNDYPGTMNDLDFCVKDVNDWEYKLKMNWPEMQIRKFVDAEATRERYKVEVRAAINAMPPGATVVVFSDCCYSGDNTKGDNPCRRKVRFIEPNLQPRKEVAHPLFRTSLMTWLAISTSDFNQPSEEVMFENGEGNGIGTYYAVRSIGKGITWRTFFEYIRAYLPSPMFEQVPQMAGPEFLRDRMVFEGPTLFIVNSTHGTYTYDQNGDEADGYDEAIVFYDGNLIDDDVNAILQSIKT